MDKRELIDLIKTGKGYTLEFKERFNNSIAREMCAFANAKGGRILLGVKDNGKITGIKIDNDLKSKIQSIARNIDPKLYIELEVIDNVLVVYIPEGKEKPYSANGQFFIRIGANSQKLTRDEIKEFFQKENLVLFDEQPNTKFNLEKDFDERLFSKFLDLSRITKNLGKKEILRNLSLFDGEYIKNAGVLFFTKDIKKFFINATIVCILYQGENKSVILDRKEFSGDVISNFEHAFTYLRSKLNTNFIIKDKRIEKLELPEEALREALINAIVHRDYFSQGHIQIDIFYDRVEITNPGGLVKGLSKKDFGKLSLPRNPLLMDLMLRSGFVEKVGSGIGRIKESMKDYGLKVEFIFTEFFRVVFYRQLNQLKYIEKFPEKFPEKTEDKIIYLVKKNKFITILELSDIIGISDRAIKKQLSKLKEKGKIVRVGPDKGGYWKVVE